MPKQGKKETLIIPLKAAFKTKLPDPSDESKKMLLARHAVQEMKTGRLTPDEMRTKLDTARVRVENAGFNANTDLPWKTLGFEDGLGGLEALFRKRGGYKNIKTPWVLDLIFYKVSNPKHRIFPDASEAISFYGPGGSKYVPIDWGLYDIGPNKP